MPSAAAAKLEKQASTEATDPMKQGITIIEHKIRNLEKRKSRLDGYRELQKSGKELSAEQLQAVAKFDEVVQTLEFARDLVKQFNLILVESAKQAKKQQRKEALEKVHQDVNRIKEILIIQDILTNMGQDNVREDFLAGRNGAVKLEESDLQHLDNLYPEVFPKHELEDGIPPFPEQLQKAADHFVSLLEGRPKEIVGTTYVDLKEKITSIYDCGYFDQTAVATVPAPMVDQVAEEVPDDDEFLLAETEIEQVPAAQPIDVVEHVAPVEPVQQPVEYFAQTVPVNVTEVIGSVSSTFNFLQDSEVEVDVMGVTPPQIPTQTFTNQNYVPPGPSPHVPETELIYQQHPPSQQFQQSSYSSAHETIVASPADVDWTVETPTTGGNWADQCPSTDSWPQPTDDWVATTETQPNDGFMPAVSGRGRGGRSARGGDRGGRGVGRGGNRPGGYQQNGNRGGGGYYNRDNRDNREGGSNYCQNGYQRDNRDGRDRDGGYRDNSYRGGGRDGEREGSFRGSRDDGYKRGSRGARGTGSGGRGSGGGGRGMTRTSTSTSGNPRQ